MQPNRILILVVLVAAASVPRLAVGGPLDTLDTPRNYQAMRSSSADANWEDGNGDCRPVAPGETLTISELNGPGRITHIWFTVAADRLFPRTLIMRMYWDGAKEPAVEAPMGDFFAVGHGALKNLTSAPVAISSEGRAFNCYWPMPFRKSARITITNTSDKPVIGLFWYVDWQKLRRLPKSTPYFHAQYRQETPCVSGEDYLILDAEGSGHYVGTVLSVRHRRNSWFGEGDDRFYIDGEAEPSLRGTGTEDYFCDAWGFRELNRPYYGVSLWEGMEAGARGTAYRWHITDPIPFTKSLKVTIEHKGALLNPDGSVITGFGERADDFYSVAFWYQTGQAKRFATMPPAGELLPKFTTIELDEQFKDGTLTPELLPQEIFSCGNGRQVLFMNEEVGATLDVPFTVDTPGSYLLMLSTLHSFDYGIYDILLDGSPLRQHMDFHGAAIEQKETPLGLQDLTAGEHTLTFRCVGANPDSRRHNSDKPGYFLGVDALILQEL